MKTWVREAAKGSRQPHFKPELTYGVDQSLLDPALQSAFVQLDCDAETQAFLDVHKMCLQLCKKYHRLTQCTHLDTLADLHRGKLVGVTKLQDARSLLLTDGRKWDFRAYVSISTIESGQMFVLSQAQVQRLLRREPLAARSGSLLDIGAGDGHVTAILASLVGQVTTTEASGPMVAHLNTRGYNSVHTSDLQHEFVQSRKPYNIISLLNVLDRADKPLTMLRSIRAMLEPQKGLILLAVVLPFAAFVEQGTQCVAPTEELPMQGGLCADGASFEIAASLLLRNVLLPAGFELVHFTRVPYLCRGDIQQPYYTLSDAIFVLKVDSKWRPNEAP